MPIDLPNELTSLRRAILEMGSVVEQRVNHAIDALLTKRVDLAKTVRHGDSEVDQMDVDIESTCLRILALTQPVAGDLRFLLAVLRMNNELERIGDEAKSLSKRVIDLGQLDPVELPSSVKQMAHCAREMMCDALTALAQEDADLARRVRLADQRVDDLQKEVFTWVQIELPNHAESTRATIDILSIARRLERIADLSTNIAEEVMFLVQGTIVRHAPA